VVISDEMEKFYELGENTVYQNNTIKNKELNLDGVNNYTAKYTTYSIRNKIFI
jgi:hypothetical protein